MLSPVSESSRELSDLGVVWWTPAKSPSCLPYSNWLSQTSLQSYTLKEMKLVPVKFTVWRPFISADVLHSPLLLERDQPKGMGIAPKLLSVTQGLPLSDPVGTFNLIRASHFTASCCGPPNTWLSPACAINPWPSSLLKPVSPFSGLRIHTSHGHLAIVWPWHLRSLRLP